MKKLGILAVMVVLATLCFAQNPPRVVLVPLENRAGTQYVYDVETLGELLSNFINETRRLNVIDRLALDAAMTARHWQTEDWDDINKTAEMGRALNAQYIARGTVSRLGDNLLVSVRILDINTAELRSSTNTQLEHMNEAYSKMNSMAQILIYNLGLPVQQAQPRQPRVSDPEMALLNTLGISLGTSFSDPRLMITIRGTYAPVQKLFLEGGCDFGFLSDYANAEYYSVYLFTHVGLYLPDTPKGGWYIGTGGSYMFGEYAFSSGKISLNIFAVDFITGFNMGNIIDLSYTVRTNFSSISHKLSMGYTYRFR
jgi:TolB-like protein